MIHLLEISCYTS